MVKFNFTKQQVIVPIPLFLDEQGINKNAKLVSVVIEGDKVVITYKDGNNQ